MKTNLQILFIAILLAACTEKNTLTQSTQIPFNQDLADDLARMAEIDQIAAGPVPNDRYQHLTQEEWKVFEDSVFATHAKALEKIFKQHGFPGYDLVGKKGSMNFWLMAQHADHNPKFQNRVLRKMKVEVDRGNADPSYYAMLVDRVNLNTGKQQIYGTQVTYRANICQAYPKPLANPETVNERRKSVGLEPIEKYLNEMTEMHFMMNKDFFSQKGITEPTLYEVRE
ncbi:hypothetical protein KIH41_10510 [Litoribacter ruber]|uniref:DUF6624 domain-containing protein n=1 Tax=Litoribacter ruber TaxID=702568 RepID=UPI001BDAC0E4|nr:DUF6624 domain-containing protein [Litoribacter ruber]MBT0811708.1 hypothetical protein [Litoribacter ruber]